MTRRRALQCFAGLPVTSFGQTRVPPLTDLVNVFEIRDVAKRKLPDEAYAAISGTDRKALERITFRPRLMVNVSKLDLSTEILGQKLFAPILVGPVSNQNAYHPDGEVATVRGAAAANAPVVISSRSSRKLSDIAAEAKTPLWFQIYAEPEMDTAIAAARNAVAAGCKVVCLTVGGPVQANPKMSWAVVERVRQSIKVPLVLKGIMSPEEAKLAVSHGLDGVVVSNHGGMHASGFADPTEMLPLVAEAISTKAAVLVDGSFRRGTDILKALALGARAVLLARPAMWGLAAYGPDGVRAVLEMLQTELARNMAMCGKPDLKSIDRSLIKIHSR